MNVLIAGTLTRLEAAVAEMTALRWGDQVDFIGDESGFVNTARKVLLDMVPRLGRELSALHFVFWAEKLARIFVPHFVDAIYRLRRIGERGAMQLAIDADGLRRVLLDVPKLVPPPRGGGGGDDDEEQRDLSGYCSYVESEMGGAVNMIKVLQASPAVLVDTFVALMPARFQAPSEFIKLCELKQVGAGRRGATERLTGERVQGMALACRCVAGLV